ncbi:hypothetical protein KSP40_PGU000474 [Platanthera guangdongensis]|uniref:Uncharacterized protein n=1 Tax=Platanthera guangdongensis TaxID=2320717 RepID=A0ABR2MXR5_9ASPA
MQDDDGMKHTTLDLSDNELTGEMPKYIGELKALKSLNLSYNNVNGDIPTSIGKLEVLESLILSHNKLLGDIPTSFGKLNYLSTLNLSNNMLTGEIAEEGQMLSMVNPNIYANNDGLCGIQINVQCVSGPTSPEVLPGDVDDEARKDGMQFIWEAVCLGYVLGLDWAIWLTYFCGIIGPNLLHGVFYR